MENLAPDRPCTSSAAHLLIHASAAPQADGWRIDSILQRLRAHYREGALDERESLNLQIHDLQGNRLLTLEDAGPLVDMALPPATYQITTQIGRTRRDYTVALEPGASVDLYLRLPPDWR